MHDDSSSMPKGAHPRAPVPPIHPSRLLRLPVARWARWTRTAAMAPARRTCNLSKNSRTKRHAPRLLRHAHERHPCLRQRQRAPMVVVTRVRTMSRPCALRGACAVEMTIEMTVMTALQMESVSKMMKITREICAWRVRLHTRDSAATFPYHESRHYSRPPRLTHRFPSLAVNAPSVLSPCLLRQVLYLSFPSFLLFQFFFCCVRACCTHTQYSILGSKRWALSLSVIHIHTTTA